ncbi:unnamed protein product [Trichobilharzia regenti]|nr:unnamed protein product [Trichobilharzia regenti]
MSNLEAAARRIAKVSRRPKVIVEKSTVPVKAAETTSAIIHFESKCHQNKFNCTMNGFDIDGDNLTQVIVLHTHTLHLWWGVGVGFLTTVFIFPYFLVLCFCILGNKKTVAAKKIFFSTKSSTRRLYIRVFINKWVGKFPSNF